MLYKPKPEAQECAKPRDLCGSDWLEYLSMHSQVNEDGAEGQTLRRWLVEQTDPYYKQFGTWKLHSMA